MSLSPLLPCYGVALGLPLYLWSAKAPWQVPVYTPLLSAYQGPEFQVIKKNVISPFFNCQPPPQAPPRFLVFPAALPYRKFDSHRLGKGFPFPGSSFPPPEQRPPQFPPLRSTDISHWGIPLFYDNITTASLPPKSPLKSSPGIFSFALLARGSFPKMFWTKSRDFFWDSSS